MKSIIYIETPRLILRALNINDAADFFAYRSDKEANKYQGFAPESIDDAIDFINKKVVNDINIRGTWHQLAIIKKDTAKLIGDIGIHFLEDDDYQVELGFTLDKNEQRKNYAYEAVYALIDYVFNVLKKHRIIGCAYPENTASNRLMERLGFIKEAHFRKSIYANGQWLDDVHYALLDEDWQKS